MTVHIFNCDNDLALGNFSPGFTPTSTIRGMMQELYALPLSWAAKGDLVLDVFSGRYLVADGKLGWLSQGTDFRSFVASLGSANSSSCPVISPWGWSPAICHRLRQCGVPASWLPTDEQLHVLRNLSSRERAVELLSQMRAEALCPPFQSLYCTDEAQVEEALYHWPQTILKAPWSGSGKGLRYGHEGRGETLRGWYQRILQQQGGVVVEPLYNKLHDLAMEFYSDGVGHVTYQGLSLFDTHPNGAYKGNLMMPESEKEMWLSQYIELDVIHAVRSWLEAHLSALVGTAYRGFLGVDMMIVKPTPSFGTSSFSLHPMVEVNLRMTMGMVSVLLQQRQPKDFRGIYCLDYFQDSVMLLKDNAQRRTASPYFRLLACGSHYRSYVESL